MNEQAATPAVSADIDPADAVRAAAPNVLRMALYQATRDPELAGMKVVKQLVRGGVQIEDVLATEHVALVHAKALAFIASGRRAIDEKPADPELRQMMEMFAGEEIEEKFFQFAKEELALDPFPRDIAWNKKPPENVLAQNDVIVVGCGISGIAAGVQLKRLGIPFTIVERNPSVGGTWWVNHYPSCRVDTSSYLYQFKFEKNYPWMQHYATAGETLAYLKFLVEKYDLMPHIRLSTAVTAAQWDDSQKRWCLAVKDAQGEKAMSARFVFSAVGVFHTPKIPPLPQMKRFQGALFHTASWDHGFDHHGKRVGIIGNGSTGSQLMPRIAKEAGKVVHFQRTAQWIMPAEAYGQPLDPALRWMFDHFPNYWNWHVYAQFASAMKLQDVMVYDAEWREQGGRINARNDMLREGLEKYISAKVGHVPELHAKLMPPFAPFGRRSVIDSGFYDALLQDNVELETAGIDHFVEDGIVTLDGVKHELDLVVLATGFEASKFLSPVDYRGRDGIGLATQWRKDGARAYLGLTMPNYPNFFMFWGPNGNARNGGYYSWAEIWTRYMLQLVTAAIEDGAGSIEVKHDVFDRYNAGLDEEMKKMLWGEEAKGSYYQNEHGRMDLAAPWVVEDFHDMLRKPDLDDFCLT